MHIGNAVALACLIGACSRDKPASPPVIPPGATACEIQDRLLDAHIACRKADPHGLSVAAAERLKAEMIELRTRFPGAARHERQCAFEVDKLRTDMAGEGCASSLSNVDRVVIAAVRAKVTPSVPGSTAEATQELAHRASQRDRICACENAACVAAVKAEPRVTSVDALRGESEPFLDAATSIGLETYDCETRPAIISAERWRKVER